jgi:hypothetical protein
MHEWETVSRLYVNSSRITIFGVRRSGVWLYLVVTFSVLDTLLPSRLHMPRALLHVLRPFNVVQPQL